MNDKQSHFKITRIISTLFFLFIFLTTTVAVASSVTLAWDPIDSAAEGSRVFVRKSGQVYDFSQPAWEGTSVTCTLNNLEDQAEYYFVVRAFADSLMSPLSNEVHYTPTVSTNTTPDTLPPSWDGATLGVGLVRENASGGSVTVEFDTASDVVDGMNLRFNVYYAASKSWNNADWTSNSVVADATVGAGSTFTHAVTVSGLTDGVSYTFGVRVEDQSGNEDDNTSTSIATPTVSLGHLALNRPTVASSYQKAGLEAFRSVDDSSTTRWASALYSDDEWIYVDLGVVRMIDRVVLNWETAYGARYAIQVSDDAVYWTTVYTEYNGNGGIDDIAFPATDARYVRMQGIQRGTVWGYSLFEFEVYGAM